MAFILLCVGVIVLAAPTPAPWGHWIALALTVIALIAYCLGLHGSRALASAPRHSTSVVDSAPLLSGLWSRPNRLRPDGSRINDVPIVIS